VRQQNNKKKMLIRKVSLKATKKSKKIRIINVQSVVFKQSSIDWEESNKKNTTSMK
jgi:hypothetical protein